MRKLIFLAFILTGCVSTPEPVVVEKAKEVAFAPQLPAPLEVCQVPWRVLIVDDQPYIGLSYSDSLTFSTCRIRVESYIEKLLLAACYYKPADEQCKETNDSTSGK